MSGGRALVRVACLPVARQRLGKAGQAGKVGKAGDRSECRSARRANGFTLVEVLVALSIVAIALTAGVQATLALTRNAERQTDTLLAHICAENELVKLRLSRQMPGVSDTRVPCEQAGQSLSVNVQVRPTPNPNFRRVDAQVFNGEYSILRLSTVVGRF